MTGVDSGTDAHGRVCAVTGAGSGLGRSIATALLTDGFSVALVGRQRARLEESASGTDVGRALVLPADVTDAAAVDEVFSAVVDQWGRVDVLVNNAGTFGPPGDVDDVDVKAWRSTVEVNLTMTIMATGMPYVGRG